MSQNFPPDLLAYIDAGGPTCVLIKVNPVQPGIETVGITDHDQNIVYDDGDGELTYYASIGADLSAQQSSSSMAVDNAETTGLMPTFDLPISEEDLRGGAWDFAKWTATIYPWGDPSVSKFTYKRGEFGQLRVIDGVKWTTELLGPTQRLKQNVVRQATRACPATFGSQYIGTPGAVVTEEFPCGKDTTAMWVSGSVTGLAEDLHFVIQTDLTAPAGTYRPGAICWTTGANAGRTYEVEDHLEDGVIVLSFALMFAPAEGDEFEIRADCTKWKEGPNGCKFHFGSEWVLHYRGRHLIPTGETGRLNTPGASG